MKERLKQLYKRISNKHLHNVTRKIKGENNRIIHDNTTLSSVLFDISGNDNRIEIEENCKLNNVVFYIRGNRHSVKIRRDCSFKRGSHIWFEDEDCSLLIGPNSTFENVHFALTEPYSTITIGRDCMFADDIDIRTGDSHSILSQRTRERINYAENVLVGDHVWVAAHSILLKGSIIPDDSIVATGSVVTKKYSREGIIIGGNPAKQIKDGITWSRKRIYDNANRNEQ